MLRHGNGDQLLFLDRRLYHKRQQNTLVYTSMETELEGVRSHTNMTQFKKYFVGRKYNLLSINIFCVLRYLQRFIAKDIQLRCRYLRERKGLFKELKVLGRKRESCISQINKDILESRHNFLCTNKFYTTILVSF